MPWRLIVLIVVCAILLGFIGLNLSNTCDISLGFKVFHGVPVYLTVFCSFILGMVCSLPFIVFKSLKKAIKKENQPKTENTPDTGIPVPPSSPKKLSGLFKKRPGTSGKSSDTGPYGIN